MELAALKLVGLGVEVTVQAGCAESATEPVPDAVTMVLLAATPFTVAVSRIAVPAARSAAVTVRLPVQVVAAPGASVLTGQCDPARLGVADSER